MARRSRIRRSFRRPRFHRPHKQGLVSKAINAGALLIGTSPLIVQAQNNLIGGNGNFQGFADQVGQLYSAGLTKGSFRWDLAVEAYGPIVAAIAFKKAMGMLRRHIRL